MNSDESRCVQRRVRFCSLDAHPTEQAVVVNYELEASLLGDFGDPMLEESRQLQKIIRLKSLNESTDLNALAADIIQKCQLINPSKLDELRTLLQYLRSRKDPTANRPATAGFDLLKSRSHSADSDLKNGSSTGREPPASISRLDEYIELLYEDLSDKIRASAMIVQLARVSDNLCELAQNETLIGALARVLREDGRKSIELSANIILVFDCFSQFSQLHNAVSQFRVGSVCFDIVEGELKREESWFDDLNQKRSAVEKDYNLNLQADYEKSLKKYQLLVKKQNQLLRAGVHLLMNLSEDARVELKMVNRGIIGLLVKMLDRDSPDLLLVVVTFLKKLSIYLENKNKMKELKIIDKLAPLFSLNNDQLTAASLQLIHNLSFDLQLRNDLVRAGLFQKLVNLSAKNRHEQLVFGVLYQLSRDDKCKVLFNTIDVIKTILNKMIEFGEPGDDIPMELTALAVNLMVDKKNAQLINEVGGVFQKLMDRTLETDDVSLLKMFRNISAHDDPVKMLFIDYHEQLLRRATVDNKCEEVAVECLAILSNLTMPQIDWAEHFNKYQVVEWLKQRLSVGRFQEDDLILEAVMFLATAAGQVECAKMLVDEDVIQTLIDLLNSKQEDDEMVLQIVFAFHVLAKHQETAPTFKESEAPAYLIDLMHDKNSEIKKICNATLDLIAEHDPTWSSRIRLEKFCSHNKQWLEMVQSQADDDLSGDFGDLDSAFAYPNLLLKTDLLNDSSSSQSDLDLSIAGRSLSTATANGVSSVGVAVAVGQPLGDSSPSLQRRPTAGPTINSASRPQTGYKIRGK